ncbi:V-type proton ATPase subunit G [Cyclospora cayetanensis]|uniref:V-type proton ATPase subunit G n=2 Tax=Cyclospora cayetanensis TaxID=88456 RepID=A0A1D3D457_9EIME|nr:V-type proton ATPase subunit G [Cyclospora cayetanensis]OEH78238.1 vacuolar atp synthase subunit [Cyclospora cayetanensis]
MKTSNALIQQLLKAEEEAEEIVHKAKENRVKMLKDARFSAEEELKAFRLKEEERFKVEVEQRLGQDDSLTNELADRTKLDIEIIKKDYMTNKDAVLAFISEKVLDVDTVVGSKKVAVLRTYAARGMEP